MGDAFVKVGASKLNSVDTSQQSPDTFCYFLLGVPQFLAWFLVSSSYVMEQALMLKECSEYIAIQKVTSNIIESLHLILADREQEAYLLVNYLLMKILGLMYTGHEKTKDMKEIRKTLV